MKYSKPILIVSIVVVGLIILLAPLPAFAQSCALCYTQAASSGSAMIQALKSGILILIAPPTFMSIGLFFVCYRKRNQTREGNGDESDREWKDGDHSDDSASKNW
ncbi:MAG TPA: hypothetical protein VNX26_10420 [Candidatus Acidoferrum sp.]|nr:hypothetical protein [Candidatus Acidoferrum sp.]